MRSLLITISLLFGAGIFYTAHAQIITTVAGNGSATYSGDGMQATNAGLIPGNIVFDSVGNLYICDGGSNRIRTVNAYGIINSIAGNGTAGYSGDSVLATATSLYSPQGIAFDSVGNIYVADSRNHRIRKVNTSGLITTFAGNGISGYTGDGGQADTAELINPVGIAIDKRGNIYFSDGGTNTIRKITTTGIITTIAGIGTYGFGGDGLAATSAQFNDPNGIAFDNKGNLYIVDHINQRIRKIDTFGIVTTFAGSGSTGASAGGYSGDGGEATAALLKDPFGIAIDRYNNVYIADFDNNRIRKVDTGGIITTIAGNGTRGYSGDGGLADTTELYYPGGVAVDCAGNVFIADEGNNRVRMIVYDHPPVFTAGHVQHITICSDADTAINALLKATDIDTGQTATWSITQPATHGTVLAAYTATTTGGELTPAGLTYTPAAGYMGNDSFKVRVSDCGFFTDSTTVYVSIVHCGLIVGAQALGNGGLTVVPNPNSGDFSITVAAGSSNSAQITVTNILGEKVKELVIATNTTTAMHIDAAPGVYFISADTENNRYNTKIVVTK